MAGSIRCFEALSIFIRVNALVIIAVDKEGCLGTIVIEYIDNVGVEVVGTIVCNTKTFRDDAIWNIRDVPKVIATVLGLLHPLYTVANGARCSNKVEPVGRA